MPFTKTNCPASFRMLRRELQNKAIEIGNTLLNAGYLENLAEVIAFSTAKLWPRYLSAAEVPNEARKMDVHLIPHPEGWALMSADAASFYFTCQAKVDALFKARMFAKNEKLKLFIHSPAGNISDTESFAVNLPKPETVKSAVVGPPLYIVKYKEAEKRINIPDSKRESVRGTSWLGRKIKNNFWIENESGQTTGTFSHDAK
jgi:uncharacterized protein YdaT